MGDVTQILSHIEAGNQGATEKLLPLIYDELRRLAAQKMAGESPDHTLQGTALVHEAYLRLVGVDRPQRWSGRGHFFAAAAEAMRRILVDAARRRQSLRRGGEFTRKPLTSLVADANPLCEGQLLDLDEALHELETHDQQAAQLIKLRYFGGLRHQEAARILGLSRREADRVWLMGRTWLFRRLANS